MDIYCPKCGEPVELDYLHDVAADLELTFDDVYQDFAVRGCLTLGGRCNDDADHERAEAAQILFDALGDDCDAIAALMEDLFGCPAGGSHTWVDDSTENSDAFHARPGDGAHCDECGATPNQIARSIRS
jgi:hypothetical protein